jgi:hypothetical protein
VPELEGEATNILKDSGRIVLWWLKDVHWPRYLRIQAAMVK